MTSSEIVEANIAEVARRIERREVSPVEVVEATLERIDALNPVINALAAVTRERALSGARQAEREISGGRWRGPLHGIPYTVKDLFDATDTRTTAASRFLADSPPKKADSAVVEKLADAGALLIGKANLHEFAFGTTSLSSVFGPVRNPWNLDRIAGGSSGGSAAGVAAGLGLGSIGTDTGGSIRIPASLSGVVGLKPTIGRISCRGLFPLAPTLDHPGPLARSVEDAAIILGAIAGHDPEDPSTANVAVPDYRAALTEDLKGVRIGAVHPHRTEAVAEVASAFRAALEVFRAAGAEVRDVVLDHQQAAREAAFVILFVESAHTHRDRMASHPELFFPDIRERFERGRAISGTEYVEALRARERIRAQVRQVFVDFDVLVSPMLPVTAPRIGEEVINIGGEEIAVPVASTTHTREWNLLGNPALSLPAGFDAENLPLAVQIIGNCWNEATVLRVGYAYQSRTEWHEQRPCLDIEAKRKT